MMPEQQDLLEKARESLRAAQIERAETFLELSYLRIGVLRPEEER